jgi:hypothetical protein
MSDEGSRHLAPYRYDRNTGVWTAGGEGSPPNVREMRVVTWNIWFGDHEWIERLDALMELVGLFLPDLIGLQEVTPRQLERILAIDWVRSGFRVSDVTGETLEPHGVVLLSRLPIRNLTLIALPTRRDRKLLLAELDTASGPLAAAVTHLESGEDGAALRESQLEIIQRHLCRPGPALLMGDLNFDLDRGRELRRLDPDMIDCWREVHGELPGNTLDAEENAMRASMDKSAGPMRCDALLLRPGGLQWRPLSIWRIGMDPIVERDLMLYPSDHFGLAATLAAA